MQGLEIREMLLTAGRGGRPGKPIVPRAVALHWTANLERGANAVNNRTYFETHPAVEVGAHYVVDDRCAVRCVPEDEMAYHAGGERRLPVSQRYTPTAMKAFGGMPNTHCIGIEMCVNPDVVFARTYANTVALTADILRRRGWGLEALWRHFDVTRKACPKYWVDDATARAYGFPTAAAGWDKFRADVAAALRSEGVLRVLEDIAGHWAEGDIKWLAERGIVTGDQAGTFRPQEPATRGEAAAMIRRAVDYVLK